MGEIDSQEKRVKKADSLDFKVLTLDQINLLRPYFEERKCRICDCTVGGTFMWRDFFKTEYFIDESTLFLKVVYYDGKTAFTVPIGDESIQSYQKIIDYCASQNIPVVLCMVTTRYLEKIMALFPMAQAHPERDWFDYLYTSEDIKNLPGKKYSGQRNHINRFIRTYPDWVFHQINEENIPDVRHFFVDFSQENEKNFTTFQEEKAKILEVFDNYHQYGLCGGYLTVQDKIIGFSIGEKMNDTLFIHIEKANREYNGAYQMLVNQFAKAYADETIHYINREEDDGDEGLRKSKMSYHPHLLLEKYTVRITNE